MLAALLHLLPGLGHPLAVLLVLHPLAELVGVAEDLLLLLPQPLELPLDLLAGFLVLGGLEGRLQLLEPVVQVGLPLGQLAEPVEDLPRLALLGRPRRLIRAGRPLLLVAVLVVRQLELVELPLRGAAAAAAPAAAGVVPGHLELPGAELEQGLVGGLLGGEAGSERGDGGPVGGLGQPRLGVLHRPGPPSPARPSTSGRAAAGRACPPARWPTAATRGASLGVVRELLRRLGPGLAADQLPGAVDDLLLELGQLRGLLLRCPPAPGSRPEPPGGCSPWRKISSKWRTSAKYMSPEVRRTLPSGPMSSAQKK